MFFSFQHSVMIDVLYSPFCVFSMFHLFWHNLFFLLQLRHMPIVPDNYFRLIFLQKLNLPIELSFRCSCIFFTWASFILSSIWIFVLFWFWWFLPEETSESHTFCIDPLYFTRTYFSFSRCSHCCKSTLFSATASFSISLADFWSDSKKESFSRSWSNRTDSLRYNFPVFISKLSECKQS